MAWLALFWASAAFAREEILPDYEMDRAPTIHVPAATKVFSERLKELWLEALARPEADLQRMAAEAIGRAHAAGFSNMSESVSGLTTVLTTPTAHLAARQAVARALITLDAKATAPQLAATAEKYGADLRLIVEPALAAWSFEPCRAVWRARLTQPGVHHRDLVLAIRCLEAVKENAHAAALVEIVNDRMRRADLRLEAARAAGLAQDSGLESDARRLMAGGYGTPQVNRLCAVQFLARHAGGDAQQLLAELAVDREPAVAVVALDRLIEIDPHLALPMAEWAMQNADPKVRQSGANACALAPDPQRALLLTRLLDDPHPTVREFVRDWLFELARQPALDAPIRQGAEKMLAGDHWRGLEQAALLLGALDHNPAAGRLVELLEFERPEVAIAAAWGLKKLAIPATLPALLDKAIRNTALRKAGRAPLGLDEQTAHLFETFGLTKFASAEALLLEYVPKDVRLTYGVPSRGAAVWALGLLHAGAPDERLAKSLMERIADDGGPSVPPELDIVKHISAVTIARMKAHSQTVPLRKYYDSRFAADLVATALQWALTDLTGEQIPERPPVKLRISNWFLESLDAEP